MPFCFQIGVTWANLNVSGKKPSSNMLLNILDKGKEIGVDIKDINLPGTPQ